MLPYQLRLILAHKDAVRTRVPLLFRQMVARSHRMALHAAHRLKDKDRIEVAFFLTIPGMWKADYLFRAMQHNPRYHPYIVIYPYSTYKGFPQEEVWDTIRRTEAFVKSKGFEYIIPYDPERKRWKDVKKVYNPDIVFFTTPYRDVEPNYYVYHFMDRLTCYISYSFVSLNLYDLHYRTLAVNLYGLCFEETEMHRQFACRYGRNGGINAVATGYPGTEVYLRHDYQPAQVWKTANSQSTNDEEPPALPSRSIPNSQSSIPNPQDPPRKKRVIWAPHHTIDNSDGFRVSTFLTYCDVMLDIAERYKDQIQMAFKPHQLLKFKLIKLWGQERTDAYYRRWAEGDNTQLEESGYVDLFLGSDAMIHDSGSFTTEYLFLNKPVMFLSEPQSDPRQLFNTFGEKAYQCHYHGHNVEDIEGYIQDVVLRGNDPMAAQRKAFFDTYLAPQDGVMPSQRILDVIEQTIRAAE